MGSYAAKFCGCRGHSAGQGFRSGAPDPPSMPQEPREIRVHFMGNRQVLLGTCQHVRGVEVVGRPVVSVREQGQVSGS